FTPEQARAHHATLLREVVRMLCAGVVHGDLSEFNILLAADGPVTRFAGDSFSTAFQFGDHLGVGYQLTPSQRVSLRLSHFSNAAIKQPNPGLNSVQMTYTYLP
ncbi:MAG: acyloxyacyl hydrolase, partial [Burkholderiaceae bacterium]